MTDQPIVMVCPGQAETPELRTALVDLAKAVVDMEARRRAALPVEDREAEDARRAESQARLRRIQARARRRMDPYRS
jgi:hypothetical protein